MESSSSLLLLLSATPTSEQVVEVVVVGVVVILKTFFSESRWRKKERTKMSKYFQWMNGNAVSSNRISRVKRINRQTKQTYRQTDRQTDFSRELFYWFEEQKSDCFFLYGVTAKTKKQELSVWFWNTKTENSKKKVSKLRLIFDSRVLVLVLVLSRR